jgi:hypothetical protein
MESTVKNDAVRQVSYRLLLFLGLAILSPLASVDTSLAYSPLISNPRVTHVTSSGATLEAEIDPQGASAGVFYQFQLLHDPGEAPTEIACPPSVPGYSACVGPQDSGALPIGWVSGAGPQSLSLDLSSAGVSLTPGRTYYYRILAANRIFSEDTAEWEPPAVLGPTKSFTTPPTGAEQFALTFTEDRANVGVQLSDAAMFTAPATAPFAAQIDPGIGSITAGEIQVPDFTTHITEPLDADVNVHFEIGIIGGSFNNATGALTLEGEANATLTSEGKECAVSTSPYPLVLSTAGNSGGANPRSGSPFIHGLSGAGAIAGQWTDMNATPRIPGQGVFVCETVDERIEGPGGIWLAQEGDVTPPAAPQLTGTVPASPGLSGTPRILGSAEAGSTVRLFSGTGCTGTPLASAPAAELSSPGIAVEIVEGTTATFSASATDAASNASTCSAPISYTRGKAVCLRTSSAADCGGPANLPKCVVPKLIGTNLRRAKSRLKAAGCALGKVRKSNARNRWRSGPLIVESTKPPAGSILKAGSKVSVKVHRRGPGDNWQHG